MTLNCYLDQMKTIQASLLEFIESDNYEEIFENLLFNLREYNIYENKPILQSLLYLVLQISNNFHHSVNFFIRIERIFHALKESIKTQFSNSEIFHIFHSNKRILLFLIEEKILNLNEYIIQKIKKDKHKYNSDLFLQPEIQKVENNNQNKMSEEEFQKFNEKRKKGENDNELCVLIQNDLIEEFIIFVNKNGISLNITIENSIFETNLFLIKNSPTLIQYAAFFGSIQIFKYLYLNNVELDNSLMFYAIHGNNPEIIHFLEEKNFLPSNEKYFIESIKCHHNDIANYIQCHYLQNENEKYQINLSKILKYYNFNFINDELIDQSSFFDFCKYDYSYMVEFFLKNKDIDINELNIKLYKIFINLINGI